MDQETDRTNYEQEHPSHLPETEFFDRATQRIDKALRAVAETQERMARNTRQAAEKR